MIENFLAHVKSVFTVFPCQIKLFSLFLCTKSLTLKSSMWFATLENPTDKTSKHGFRSPRKHFITHLQFTSVTLLHKSNVHDRTAIIVIYKAVVLEINAVECDWEPVGRRKCSAWLTCTAHCRNKLNMFKTPVLRAPGCNSACICSRVDQFHPINAKMLT